MGKLEPKPQPQARIQYGALPFRIRADGEIEILLVTSRTTRRWIIPKGWPIRRLSGEETAAREAFEEAGVTGTVAKKALGTFVYEKVLKPGSPSVACDVSVFALLVEEEHHAWPEASQRERGWFHWREAIGRLSEDNIRALIIAFVLKLQAPK